MIDLALIRSDPERVRISQRARGEDPGLVDVAVAAEVARRGAAASFEALRADQKRLGKEVGSLRGKAAKAEVARSGWNSQHPTVTEPDSVTAQLSEVLGRAASLAEQVKVAESVLREAERALEAAVSMLSNLVDPQAPVGGEEDFTVLRQIGAPRDFAAEGFTPRDHVELGESLGAIDVPRGAKVSGSRFYYLTGDGALLELALVNLAMSLATANGLTPMIPPALVKSAAMEGTGFLGQAAENVYRLDADDLYLVGTAEVPLAAYHMDEILDPDLLPFRYAGFSPCFRREAGSHGKDTRGIFRVHWFDKVEMFSFVAAAQAEAEHERLLGWERQFLDALEIPYRVIDVASGDLGASAARKFDCEAWIPSQGRYRELTSASNCTQFQARRLRIRTRGERGNEPVATLNGTLCAVTRTIIAVLENHQQSDGSVILPLALRPFLGGRSALTPK